MNIPPAITGNLLVYTPPLSSGADSKARVSFVASQVFVGSRGRSSQQTSPTHWESPSAGLHKIPDTNPTCNGGTALIELLLLDGTKNPIPPPRKNMARGIL